MHTTNRSSRPSTRHRRLFLLYPTRRLFRLRRVLPFVITHTLTDHIGTPRPPHILQHRPPSLLLIHPMESRFHTNRKRAHTLLLLLLLPPPQPLIPPLRPDGDPQLDRRDSAIRRTRPGVGDVRTDGADGELFSFVARGEFGGSGDFEEAFDGLEGICAEVYVGCFAAFGC